MTTSAVSDTIDRATPTGLVDKASCRPLSLALELFDAFDEAGVVYCHFKSNEHLVEGLAGVTDLDVLVDRRHARAAQAVLMENGFKRFTSKLAGAYPAVEDYLGFDEESGRMLHGHVHYALVAGEPHLKSYQLRLADDILEARVLDSETGVYVTDPDFEMVLLLVRCALKLRWRDAIFERLGRPYLRGGLVRELRWLMERIDADHVREIAERAFGPDVATDIERLVLQRPTTAGLRRLRSSAMAALADQRTYGTLGALALSVCREAAWLFSAVNRRTVRLPVAARRNDPIGGLVVALLGPDGCGKSTLTRELRSWLGWKLDVYPAYFGSGDGSVSLQRLPLKIALSVYRRLRPEPSSEASSQSYDGDPAAGTQARHGCIARARWIWAISLALEKRAKLRSVVRARNRAMVVVADRYPQVQVMGFNDGPLLSHWLESSGSLRRRIARWELEIYQAASRNAPNVAIKLEVSPEVASGRKSEVSKELVRERLEALSKIDYGPRCDHIVIDADRPYEDVLADVKAIVWERL